MNGIFICYPRCSTCRRAQAWLDAHGIAYTLRDIKSQNPKLEELAEWHHKSGLPLKRFFNTSGIQYRALSLASRLNSMSEAEQLELLSSDGMLVKRPILVMGETVLVGFKEQEWAQLLLKTEGREE